MRKIFTFLMALAAFTACHESAPPMGGQAGLDLLTSGGSGNITTSTTPECKTDEVLYGGLCYPKILLATDCPTANSEYKFVDFFTAEKRDDINQPLPAPQLSKHVGGKVKAVASFENNLFWSKGSTLYVQGSFGKKSQELFSVINSIAIKRLAENNIIVAVGTKQNLQTFNFNADGTFTPLAVFGRLGGINSVAFANSADHIRRAVKETSPIVEPPAEGVSVSLNVLPPSSGHSYTYTSSDYIYTASDYGVYRMLSANVGGGCVEEVFRPQDGSSAIKVAADGNIVALLSETSSDSWKSLSDEEKEVYIKSMSDFKNEDLSFIINYSLWPDKVFRSAKILNLADGSQYANKSGIISDIAVNGSSAYVAGTDSPAVKSECASDCVKKAVIESLSMMNGLKLNGIIFKYSADGESQITPPKTSVTLPNNYTLLKDWHPAFVRLAAGSDEIYAWGAFGYAIKVKATPELVPTSGFNNLSNLSYMFPPIQIANNAGELFGAFPADSDSAALVGQDGFAVASNGFKPSALKISNSNELLFLNKKSNEYELFAFSGDNPLLAAEFDDTANPVAFDKGEAFSISGQTAPFEQQSKFKLKLVSDQSSIASEPIFIGENILLNDIEVTESNKILLLASQLQQDNKPLYFVYSLTYNGTVLTPSKASKYKISSKPQNKPRFLLTLKNGDKEMPFINAGGMILLYPNNPDFDLLANPLTAGFTDSAADFAAGKKDEALGIALTNDNKLILFSLTKAGAAPLQSSLIPLGVSEKPYSTKLVMSGETAYLLANFSPNDQRLYKIKIQENKIQIEQAYTGLNLRDIALKDGKLVSASVDNGVEF